MTAEDEAIHVGLGDEAYVGATVEKTIVNDRKHRVVVLVCHEGSDTLYSSDVTIDGGAPEASLATAPGGVNEKELCDLGGASEGDIGGHGHVSADIDLGSSRRRSWAEQGRQQ